MAAYFDEDYLDEEVVDFIQFMSDEDQEVTGFLTKKRVDKHFNELCEVLNIFVTHPDLFVDLITPHSSHFSLFFFQRIYLRCMARGTGTFLTASRGTSKSFLADLDRYLHCMFIPRHNTSITAGSAKQAAEIAKQKVINDLWVKFPLLANEMQKRKVAGKWLEPYKTGNDYVEFVFKNGSSLSLGNVRGLRRQSLICEEVIEQDETKVNEVYIPMLNEPRKMSNGLINPEEPQSQQIYITTAGYQSTFSYQKLIEILCRSVLQPGMYFALLSSYKLPLALGLTSKRQVEDILNSPSFSKASFEREYESVWSNAPVGAAFSASLISNLRQVKKVEFKYSLTPAQEEQDCFYVISVDMSKDGSAETAVGVAKVIPKEHYFTYKLINLFSIESTDYMVVANELKKTVIAYNARMLIYDANGVGSGIRDWLNKTTSDAQGVLYEGLGIINPPTTSEKDVIKYPIEKTICYEIKSGGKVGEAIHFFYFSRMSTGAITYPLKLTDAINLYSKSESFKRAGKGKQLQILQPFKTMDKMEGELKNLDIVNTSDKLNQTLQIVRRNTKIQKDYFSMMEYLVWAVNQHIENDYYKKKRRRNQKRVIALFD